MALIDFLERAENVLNAPAGAENALTMADIEMATAQKMQENRTRREELQKKIENLRSQKAELEAQKEKLRASSLSKMDEDKIVAMAKAKGISDKDIDAWLRARQQRSAREISLGQKEELGKQAKAEARKATALEKANKEARKQAILDARKAYETANKPVETEEYESKVSELDSLEFTFNNLKESYEEDYNEKLEYTLSPRKVQATPADGSPKTDEIPPIPADVELTEDQRREWNKTTTTKDQRDKIIAQIRDKKSEEAREKARKRREEAEEKANKKAEQEEAEAEAKEKKKAEALDRREKIKADSKNPNLSRAAKDALVARYRKTFEDTYERTPSRTEAEKVLFGE